jgi:hypothetical protein
MVSSNRHGNFGHKNAGGSRIQEGARQRREKEGKYTKSNFSWRVRHKRPCLTGLFFDCCFVLPQINNKGDGTGTSGTSVAEITYAANYEETKKREEERRKADEKQAGHRETLDARRKKEKAKVKSAAAPGPGKNQKKSKTTGHGIEPNKHNPPRQHLTEDEESDEDNDEYYDQEEWKIEDHAVDLHDGKPKFKVIHGKRKDGRFKFLWGEYALLTKDKLAGLDDYIRTKCREEVYRDLLVKKTTTKKTAPAKIMAAKPGRPCNHGEYSDQVTYRDEPTAAYCAENYYLHGLECGNNCGAVFVPGKAVTVKETMRAVMPSSNAPVYCCVNIVRTSVEATTSGGGTCRHVVCNGCWKKGILSQSVGATRGRRSSRN